MEIVNGSGRKKSMRINGSGSKRYRGNGLPEEESGRRRQRNSPDGTARQREKEPPAQRLRRMNRHLKNDNWNSRKRTQRGAFGVCYDRGAATSDSPCGVRREAVSATPLWQPRPGGNRNSFAPATPSESGVAASLCHRTPKQSPHAPTQRKASRSKPERLAPAGGSATRRRNALATHSLCVPCVFSRLTQRPLRVIPGRAQPIFMSVDLRLGFQSQPPGTKGRRSEGIATGPGRERSPNGALPLAQCCGPSGSRLPTAKRLRPTRGATALGLGGSESRTQGCPPQKPEGNPGLKSQPRWGWVAIDIRMRCALPGPGRKISLFSWADQYYLNRACPMV